MECIATTIRIIQCWPPWSLLQIFAKVRSTRTAFGQSTPKKHMQRSGRIEALASIVLIAAVGVLPISSGALPLEARFLPWDATRGPPTGIIALGGGAISQKYQPNEERLPLAVPPEWLVAAVELARP